VAEESYYITAGTGELIVDQETHRVTAGDLVLIKAQQTHQIKSIGDENLEFLAICVPAWHDDNSVFIKDVS
jgi:mannose-6-phosphate isomerase-like protein (cupin superfamily)